MKKKILLLFVIAITCISLTFSKDKILEDSTSLLYSYTDWTEFYTELIESTKKDTYKYAYLKNFADNREIQAFFEESKNDNWKLVSYKRISGRDMTYSFYVCSPNNHITCLILSNKAVDSSQYEIAYKFSASSMVSVSFSSSETKKTSSKKEEPQNNEDNEYKIFLEKITTSFDEQLCFFDEEIPVKLIDFAKSQKK